MLFGFLFAFHLFPFWFSPLEVCTKDQEPLVNWNIRLISFGPCVCQLSVIMLNGKVGVDPLSYWPPAITFPFFFKHDTSLESPLRLLSSCFLAGRAVAAPLSTRRWDGLASGRWNQLSCCFYRLLPRSVVSLTFFSPSLSRSRKDWRNCFFILRGCLSFLCRVNSFLRCVISCPLPHL